MSLVLVANTNQEGLEYHPRSISWQLPVASRRCGSLSTGGTRSLAAVFGKCGRNGKENQTSGLASALPLSRRHDQRGAFAFFYVQWGQGDFPAVKVTIDGTAEEVLCIQMEDAFSRRPPLVIPDARKLNDTPDPPVMHLQRSQLPPMSLAARQLAAPMLRPPLRNKKE